ncbi:MAG: electron transfer flavoprotein subunit alpha, partial [Porticoccaceae bacterium]|nr:electron transfer flavoprotein subunit alpha [Porticoccaceae bacterium]
MSILILAEHDNAVLNAATLNSVTAALEIGGDIDLLVAGKDCGTVADQAAEVANVRKVLYADENAYQFGLAENIALLVAEQSAEYSHILATATTSAKNIMPRVAALLDMQAISDISAVVSDDTFERPIYAGSMIATVQSKDAKKIVTVRGTAFDAAATSGGSGQIISIESDHDTQNSRFVGEEVAESDRPELAAAGTVVSGGRALGSEENFSMIYSLADALGAAVGASRAAVDAGYAPNDMQVGQTGK